MPAKTYGIVCTKGGVGKTTTCFNLGALLADMGQRVLLIDCDPQQSLSSSYELESQAPYGLTQLYKSASSEGCISKTRIKNLDIVINDSPGSDSGPVTTFLRESFTHLQNLLFAIQSIKEQYDYILIDTQGTTGIIQESVIFASDVLISPIQPKPLDSRELIHGTVELVNRFKPKQGFSSVMGRPLPPMKVLINQWDRTTSSESIIQYLRKEFDLEADGQIIVLNTIIPRLGVYSDAMGAGVPVHRLEQSRRGNTRPALLTMYELIVELEPKLSGIEPDWEGKLVSIDEKLGFQGVVNHDQA